METYRFSNRWKASSLPTADNGRQVLQVTTTQSNHTYSQEEGSFKDYAGNVGRVPEGVIEVDEKATDQAYQQPDTVVIEIPEETVGVDKGKVTTNDTEKDDWGA